MDDQILDLDANYEDYWILESDWASSWSHSGLLARFMQLEANDVHRVIIRTMPFGDVIENHSRTMLASVVIFFLSSLHIYILILHLFFELILFSDFILLPDVEYIYFSQVVWPIWVYCSIVSPTEEVFIYTEILGCIVDVGLIFQPPYYFGPPTEHLTPPGV